MRQLSKIAIFLVLVPYIAIATSVGAIDVINAQTTDGYTPLHRAIENKNYEMVGILLESKANPNQVDNSIVGPLQYAIELNQDAIALLLLEKGAVLDDSALKKKLVHASFNFSHLEVLKCLIKEHKDLDIWPTFLHNCMSKGVEKDFITELITKCDPDLTIKDKDGFTLLHHAVVLNWKDIAEFLIALKADVNAVDNLERTPLHYSAMNDPAMVSILLEKGANKELQDKKGRTPLYNAAKVNSMKIVKLLIENDTSGKIVPDKN